MSLNDETRSDISPTLSNGSGKSDNATDSYSYTGEITQSDDDFVILE